jgi:hypothetical protein
MDELLESYSSELANEDLLEMENSMNDESEEIFFAEPIKQHSTKQMTKFFKHIDSVIRIIEESDSNETRMTRVMREIQNFLAYYKELYRERKNAARELSLDCFIEKVEDHQHIIPGTLRDQESDDPDSPDPVLSSVRSM